MPRSAAVLALLVACTPEVVEIPARGAAVMIVVREGEDGSVDARVLDARAIDRFTVARGSLARITSIHYPDSLAALDLEPGPLPLDEGAETRALPMWSELHQLLPQESEETPQAVMELRMPVIDRARCAGAGGCFSTADASEEELRCTIPCPPPPDPLAPEPPLPPAPAVDPEIAAIPTALSCTGPSAQRYRATSCAGIGSECPADGWPPNPAAFYVRAGARGTGTRADPFGSIGEALAVSAPGTTIAIGTGDYPESIAVPSGRTLAGACVRDVSIGGAVLLSGEGAAVRDLELARLDADLEGTATLDGVLVSGPIASVRGSITAAGVVARGGITVAGELALIDSVVEGAEIAVAGRLTLDRTAIRAPWVGIALAGGSVQLAGATIEAARGIDAGAAEISGSAIAIAATAVGIGVNGGSASLSLVRIDLPASGTAIVATDARVTLAGVTIAGGDGIYVRGAATATITDLIARDLAGIAVLTSTHGASLYAARVRAERVQGSAALAAGAASMTLEDLTVSDVSDPRPSTIPGGVGVNCQFCTALSVERASITGVEQGIRTIGEGDVELSDLSIESTGIGIAFNQFILTKPPSAVLHAARIAVASRMKGLEIRNFTEMTIEDVRVEGPMLVGIEAHTALNDRLSSVQRVHVEDAGGAALSAVGANLEVIDFFALRSAAGLRHGTTFGIDPSLQTGMSVDRFAIVESSGAGVEYEAPGSLALARGRIERCAYGAQFAADFDPRGLMHLVLFEGNGALFRRKGD